MNWFDTLDRPLGLGDSMLLMVATCAVVVAVAKLGGAFKPKDDFEPDCDCRDTRDEPSDEHLPLGHSP